MSAESALRPIILTNDSDPLLRAVAAYLARFKGATRTHTDSDLRAYLTWCRSHGLDPLRAQRVHVELYLRWMQEVREFKPSTISRRVSVLVGFYQTCVLDGVLPLSPADHVRRPNVPPESPTLGLSHLQFEAMLSAGKTSGNINDFALVAMLGLLGLRIFEACGANIEDLGEEHGHRVLKVRGKGGKVVLTPLPPAVQRAIDRAVDGRATGPVLRTTRAPGWTGTPPRAGFASWPRLVTSGRAACIPICSGTLSSPPCSTPAWTCAMSRSPPVTPTLERPCGTTAPATTSTATPTTSSPPIWPQGPRRRHRSPCFAGSIGRLDSMEVNWRKPALAADDAFRRERQATVSARPLYAVNQPDRLHLPTWASGRASSGTRYTECPPRRR
jgi:hypothetical protein